MKRTRNHPDQLTLSLAFIRTIECAISTRFPGAASPQNEGKEGTAKKKIPFARSLAAERKRHGFTQEDAAEILLISHATIERWETGKTVPKPATQEGAIAAIRASKRSPGKEKLRQVSSIHHLDWEKGKGWRLRFTLDVGKKVVGKRISLRLGTFVLEEALQSRKVAVSLLAKLGVTVRQRVIKRKGIGRGEMR